MENSNSERRLSATEKSAMFGKILDAIELEVIVAHLTDDPVAMAAAVAKVDQATAELAAARERVTEMLGVDGADVRKLRLR
jgi:hypothetical protein